MEKDLRSTLLRNLLDGKLGFKAYKLQITKEAQKSRDQSHAIIKTSTPLKTKSPGMPRDASISRIEPHSFDENAPSPGHIEKDDLNSNRSVGYTKSCGGSGTKRKSTIGGDSHSQAKKPRMLGK